MEIRPNRVKQKLATGEIAYVVSGFTHPDDIDAFGPVGFDGIFNRLFDDLGTVHHSINSGGFPPYNLKKDGYKYLIEMAVAGFSKDDISVHVYNKLASLLASSFLEALY